MTRRLHSLIGRTARLALTGTLACLVLSSGASAAPVPPAWAPRPSAFCRYDLNVAGLADPYVVIGRTVPRGSIVCPFVAGQTNAAQVYIGRLADGCDRTGWGDLTVLQATRLTAHEFGKQISCTPFSKPMPDDDVVAPRAVFLIKERMGRGPPRAVIPAISGQGWPISFFEALGENDIQYLCFEMLPGAKLDPLPGMRAAGAVGAGATETMFAASSCRRELAKIGVKSFRTSGEASPMFSIRLKASTTSPSSAAFRASVLAQIAKTAPDPPRQSSYMQGRLMFTTRDGAAVALEDSGSPSATLEVQQLTPSICGLAFAIMGDTDAYLAASDDQAADIVLTSTRGAPPPKHIVFAAEAADSPQSLCETLRPAFARWRQDLHDRSVQPDSDWPLNGVTP